MLDFMRSEHEKIQIGEGKVKKQLYDTTTEYLAFRVRQEQRECVTRQMTEEEKKIYCG